MGRGTKMSHGDTPRPIFEAVTADCKADPVTESMFTMDSPLGHLALVSAIERVKRGEPQDQGARNLLGKAMRCLEAGDDARADTFILRASALRSRTVGEGDTARVIANAMLFDAVIDTLEAADEDDDTWLDHALDVLADCDGVAAAELAHGLQVAMHDWVLGKRADRRITAAVGRLDSSDAEWTRHFDRPCDVDAVRQVLWTVIRYARF